LQSRGHAMARLLMRPHRASVRVGDANPSRRRAVTAARRSDRGDKLQLRERLLARCATVVSSHSATRATTARSAACVSTARSSAWRRRRTATGWSRDGGVFVLGTQYHGSLGGRQL
jgi:hypothetical protein